MRYLLVVAVLLLGTGLRIYQLADAPSSAGWDPAFYGVDALQILAGERPVYFASNFGREVLYSYLVAGMFAAIGSSDFALHLTTALCSVVTIAATYRVAAELLATRGRKPTHYAGGLIAAAIVATSYWHIVWSRFGVRAVLTPTFICLVVYFLVRGLRRNNRRLIITAGILGGLSIHTYQIAQLLPLLVLVIAAVMFRPRKNAYSHLLISLAAAIVIVLPLGWYALDHPGVFNRRIQDVALYNNDKNDEKSGSIIERMKNVGDFFFVDGEISPKFSMVGKWGIDRIAQVGFASGLLILLWQWRRKRSVVLLAWLLIMLLPAVLADSEPISKRALGMVSAVAITSEIGLVALFSWHRTIGRVAAIGFGIALLFTSYQNMSDYLAYVRDPAVQGLFAPQISEMAHYIDALPDDELVYLSADNPQHPNMLLHTNLRSASSTMVRGYNGWHCLIFPETTERPTTYVLSEPNSLPLLSALYVDGRAIDTPANRYGYGDYFDAFRIPQGATATWRPQHERTAVWSDQFVLHGFDLAAANYAPGDTIDLTLYLSALQRTAERYTLFVHLLDPVALANGAPPLRGQRDIEPCNSYYPTSVWHPADVVRDRYSFQIAADTAPGSYQLMMGFYTWQNGVRLPIGDDDMVLLQQITVTP